MGYERRFRVCKVCRGVEDVACIVRVDVQACELVGVGTESLLPHFEDARPKMNK